MIDNEIEKINISYAKVTDENQRIKKLDNKVYSEVMLKDEFKVSANIIKRAREPNQQLNQNLPIEPTLTEMKGRQPDYIIS